MSVSLSWGTDFLLAQEEGHKEIKAPPCRTSTHSKDPTPIKGYPLRMRRIGGPTDVEWNLDDSFPKQGSVWELVLKFIENRHKSKP